jgi:hypothetical protein
MNTIRTFSAIATIAVLGANSAYAGLLGGSAGGTLNGAFNGAFSGSAMDRDEPRLGGIATNNGARAIGDFDTTTERTASRQRGKNVAGHVGATGSQLTNASGSLSKGTTKAGTSSAQAADGSLKQSDKPAGIAPATAKPGSDSTVATTPEPKTQASGSESASSTAGAQHGAKAFNSSAEVSGEGHAAATRQ